MEANKLGTKKIVESLNQQLQDFEEEIGKLDLLKLVSLSLKIRANLEALRKQLPFMEKQLTDLGNLEVQKNLTELQSFWLKIGELVEELYFGKSKLSSRIRFKEKKKVE